MMLKKNHRIFHPCVDFFHRVQKTQPQKNKSNENDRRQKINSNYNSVLKSLNPPKRGGIYPTPSPPMASSRPTVRLSWRPRPPLLFAHVSTGKQMNRFGATLEISIYLLCFLQFGGLTSAKYILFTVLFFYLES